MLVIVRDIALFTLMVTSPCGLQKYAFNIAPNNRNSNDLCYVYSYLRTIERAFP